MPSIEGDGPVEVIELIIGHLRLDVKIDSVSYPSDKRDLHSCTLVSKTWRWASQPYLFHDMAYSFHTGAGHDDGRTIPMLCSFLQEHPHMAVWIRRLKLRQELRLGTRGYVDTCSLGRLLSLFSKLHEIYLADLMVSSPPNYAFLEVTKRLSVDRLLLYSSSPLYYYEYETTDVRAILRCFSEIGEMIVPSALWDRIPDLTIHDPHPPAIDPPIVRELRLHISESNVRDSIILTVSKSLDITNVRALTISSNFCDIYAEFVDLFNISLERICFQAPRGWYYWLSPDRTGDAIAHCVKLKELTLYLSLIRDGETLEKCASGLCLTFSRALLTSTHPDLVRVGLVVEAKTLYEGVDGMGIDVPGLTKHLDDTLVRVVRHTGVRKIGFEWHSLWKFTADRHEGCMRRLFPKLHENGMMEFLGGWSP